MKLRVDLLLLLLTLITPASFALNSIADTKQYEKAIAGKNLAQLKTLIEHGFNVFEDKVYRGNVSYYKSYPIAFMIIDSLDKSFSEEAFRYILTLESCPAFYAMYDGNVDSYFSGQLLVFAFNRKSKSMVDLVLDLFPEVLTKDIGAPRGGSQPPAAIAEAVRTDNIEMVKYLISNKAFPVDYVYKRGSLGFNENLLTWSRSTQMDALLIGLGVSITISLGEWNGVCADNNVRIRESFGLDSKVLGKIDNGTKIVAVERSSKNYTLDGKTSCWIRIKTENGKTGWSFGAFYSFDFGL